MRIALTSGEPAGVGPELCAQLAATVADPGCELTCLGDRDLLAQRARDARVPLKLAIEHHPLRAPCTAGRLDAANAPYVLGLLDAALEGLRSGRYDAIVTAPVHKGIINDAGIAFSGHTEYLAQRTGAARPVMMLVAERLRVALATTHLPLRAVPDAVTPATLGEVLRILDHDLRRWWGLARPRIAVCGLNPHAGESGHLGDEEQRVIGPAIEAARRAGIDARGPLPADTAFVPRELAQCDAVLAMYHDQGLPVLKHAGFGHAVNVTLGLPILRTSVDHGTALDLAGTGRADAGSMAAALALAVELAARRSSSVAAAG
ncbi:MAG: 4-hydroxythreonine-4-phosphate dehydrogenase PdxA [Steroidobacteraceae bacterium]